MRASLRHVSLLVPFHDRNGRMQRVNVRKPGFQRSEGGSHVLEFTHLARFAVPGQPPTQSVSPCAKRPALREAYREAVVPSEPKVETLRRLYLGSLRPSPYLPRRGCVPAFRLPPNGDKNIDVIGRHAFRT